MTPKVTVLLPVYNAARFLRASIDSILRQSFEDFELLIVDDCSSDDSVAIVESYSDRRIRMIRSGSRLKLSGVLNLGLDNCEGEFVARMDADDVSLSDRLARQVKFMESRPELGMSGGWVLTFGEHPSSGTVFRYPLKSEEIRATLLFDNPFAHPTVMFRKKLLDCFNLRFNGDFYPAEDYELWIRALECFPTANLNQVLLKYQLHGSSMTLSGIPDMDTQALRMLRPEFAKIGVVPTDDEFMLHRLISTNRLPAQWSEAGLSSFEKWLCALIGANGKTGRYDARGFRKAVEKIWFGVCQRSELAGVCARSIFHASDLRGDLMARARFDVFYLRRVLLAGGNRAMAGQC